MIVTKEILSEATRLVGTDRQKDYGDKVENHNNIAKLWSAYLDVKIEAHDVAIMMTLLKVARTKLGSEVNNLFLCTLNLMDGQRNRFIVIELIFTRGTT